MSDDPEPLIVQSTWAGIQRVAAQPRPAASFEGRKGYRPGFLGRDAKVALPEFTDRIAPGDIARLDAGGFELKYEHFSTAQCVSRRVPFWSACNVDGARAKTLPRHDTWSFDGRIPRPYQMLHEAYGPQDEGKFSRGHMTRRQDPNWGPLETAQRANADTFTATNACPQWQPFNEGIWGDLEDYLLGNAKGDRKKISVITGPVLADDDPERFGVKIPRDFWKVVAFVSARTQALAAIAYVMSQGKYLETGLARDLEDFDLSQRPLAYVEARTGLRFADLAGKDVLAGADQAFIQPIRRLADTRLPQ